MKKVNQSDYDLCNKLVVISHILIDFRGGDLAWLYFSIGASTRCYVYHVQGKEALSSLLLAQVASFNDSAH